MKKVIVGMSGGVDSSAAAILLKNQGYEVAGATFKMFDGFSESAAEDARSVCEFLGIEHHVFDVSELFSDKVVGQFVQCYERGETPNPCVECNVNVKWASLLMAAEKLSADFVATGHYAQVVFEDGRYKLKTSATHKDQSYALYRLSQEQLSKTLFPLYGLEKEELRELLRKKGLKLHSKPDSQDICFIQNGGYGDFLQNKIIPKFGNFVDGASGKILGSHKGIHNYTVGQRKGLKIAVGRPVYVKEINAINGDVVLVDNDELFTKVVVACNVNLISAETLEKGEFEAKIRYNHRAEPCVCEMKEGLLICEFNRPQRAVTPGQALVLYKNNCVVGGGVIVRAIFNTSN